MACFSSRREFRNAANSLGTGEIEDGWVVVNANVDCRPPAIDIDIDIDDARLKKGKKNKRLKDWE